MEFFLPDASYVDQMGNFGKVDIQKHVLYSPKTEKFESFNVFKLLSLLDSGIFSLIVCFAESHCNSFTENYLRISRLVC